MVRRSLWNSASFASLPDDETRLLFFYFLTNPHQKNSGCCVLKEAYVLADLALTGADWDWAKYRTATTAIERAGMIKVDDITGEILITKWWQGNEPNNPKWYAGARAQCENIASASLRKAALDDLEACWRALQEAKGTHWPGGKGPSGDGPSPNDPLGKFKNQKGYQ
jgi:hypothetical protein